MFDILVKIMAEILGVFGLATKEIKQGRFSKLFVSHKFPLDWRWNSEICKETYGRQ